MTGPNKTGFFSGFNAADKVVEDVSPQSTSFTARNKLTSLPQPPKYSIKINDTQPIFFYCSAPGSCLTYGMVGAINPTNSTTIANQQSLAKKSAYMLNPGEPFPPEAPLPSDVPNAIPSGITLPSAPASKKASLSAGAIAGIVIGALSVIVLAALLFFFWGRTKSLKDEVERKESKLADSSGTQQQPHPDPAPFQQYSMVQSQAMSPHAQSYHGHNASVSSAGYFSPTHTNQQQQPHQGQEHKYTSPTMAQHPAFSNPGQMSPRTYELPHASLQSPPSQRSGSPHCLSLNTTQTPTLGPYGIERAAGPAPPYGYHVNSQIGPQEMDGTPVGKESEGGEKGESERVQERGARWEEVKGDEGRMF